MKKLTTLTGAALLAASLSGAAFAQANMNAPQPNSTGTGVTTPGTTSTGQAVDNTRMKRQTGTTGMNAKSGSGSKMKSDEMKTPNSK